MLIDLAKQVANHSPEGPEPFIGISEKKNCSHERLFLDRKGTRGVQPQGVDRPRCLYMAQTQRLIRFALSLKRCDLHILVGQLSGHTMLKRRLAVKKTCTNPTRPMYLEKPHFTFEQMPCYNAFKILPLWGASRIFIPCWISNSFLARKNLGDVH